MSSFVSSVGITIEYETMGSPSDPPLLFVMGFTAQLTAWPEGLMQKFADAGYFVIRFDNRDCGLSHKFDGQMIDLGALMIARANGDNARTQELALYTLSDMADDAIAVLDHLGIERAHIVGASMGGMIAQTVAIEHGARILTLTSIMSTTGEPEHGQSTPEAQLVLLTPGPTDRQGVIDAAPKWTIWMSKKHVDLDAVRKRAADSYDRSFYPEGSLRQLAAMIASGSRRDGLVELDVPTLVIHGLDDTLISPSGGQRTAELIPSANLLLVNDMGHDLPEPLWPLVLGAIVGHTKLRT